jgi:hypothetical protein
MNGENEWRDRRGAHTRRKADHFLRYRYELVSTHKQVVSFVLGVCMGMLIMAVWLLPDAPAAGEDEGRRSPPPELPSRGPTTPPDSAILTGA